MRAACAIGAFLALSACMQAGGQGGNVVQDGARVVARQAVNAAVASQLPGVDATPVTDCIIDNASLDELITLARIAAMGSSGVTEVWPVVQTIGQRPATLECFSQNLSFLQMANVAAGGLR